MTLNSGELAPALEEVVEGGVGVIFQVECVYDVSDGGKREVAVQACILLHVYFRSAESWAPQATLSSKSTLALSTRSGPKRAI